MDIQHVILLLADSSQHGALSVITAGPLYSLIAEDSKTSSVSAVVLKIGPSYFPVNNGWLFWGPLKAAPLSSFFFYPT